ncbi:MAG: hypothetical protein AB1696_12170 [Planctomycetota bacterium]
MKDPIVEEVRKARDKHARRFNYNLDAICQDIRKRQTKCGHKLVRFGPKKLKPTAIST